MKQFLYCEITDGGMNQHIVSDAAELSCLYGWLRSTCRDEDAKLIEWMDIADVGDYADHRLGVIVRLKDM